MLKVEDLHVYYGSIHAIKGISFEVNEGEIVTLIGANGAGKSTTLKTVPDMMRPKPALLSFRGEYLQCSERTRSCQREWHMCRRDARIFLQMTVRKTWRWAPIPEPTAK